MTGRTVLVTGAAGFIGSRLLPALHDVYDHVTAIDLLPPTDDGTTGDASSGAWITADMLDVLPEIDRFDTVIHLAANVGGRSALERKPLTVAANLKLDVTFFEYVARVRPARAVYLSSSAVYGSAGSTEDTRPETEVDATAATLARPDDVYGWVKLTGERLAHVVTHSCDVPITIYRPFSLYGPTQPDIYPVPAIVRRACERHDPLTVWGSGRQVRDFVHIDDAVAAIIASHAVAPTAEPVNICSGIGTTFAALARLAADVVGYAPTICGDESKPSGVDHRVGDPHRLHQWFTTKIDIADGVLQLVDVPA